MAEIPKLRVVKPETIAPCEEDALIPPGRYELAYVRHDYRYIFQRGSLDVTFSILGASQPARKANDLGIASARRAESFTNSGVTLHCYYRVTKHQRNYRAGPKSKLMRDARNLFGRTARGLPWDQLQNVIVVGEVVTVTRDSAEKDLGQANYYSIIDRLVRIL